MPNYSSICDVCLKAENFPSHIEDFSELKNLIINDAPRAVTYSRRVAVSQQVANLVEKYEAWGLAYLCGVEEVLDRLKIEEAIKHLEHLFSQIRLKPEVASSCSLYECSVHEILDALESPDEAPIPEDLRDDEGEGLVYALAYLKAHFFLLQHAQKGGFFVAHRQSHHLDGSDA